MFGFKWDWISCELPSPLPFAQLSQPFKCSLEKEGSKMKESGGKGQKRKLITWADLVSLWLKSFSICFNLLLACNRKGEGSVRKRYGDGQVETQRKAVVKLNLPLGSAHASLPTCPSSLTHTCVDLCLLAVCPQAQACGLLAQLQSRHSRMPAGSDRQSCTVGTPALWFPANNSSL